MPPDKDLASIYRLFCEFLHDSGDHASALSNLDEGIRLVPVEKGLENLYLLKIDILLKLEQAESALETAKMGYTRMARTSGVSCLYIKASDIFCQLGRDDDAISVLKQGADLLVADPAIKQMQYAISKVEAGVSARNLKSSVVPESIQTAARPVVLVMATEWFSSHGGLSTFSRQLCIELAKSGLLVYCAVPDASSDEVGNAAESNVNLIKAPAGQSMDPLNGLYRKLTIPTAPDIVIGHGRITGPAAYAQVEDNYNTAARVHFIHMAPGEIEWFKGKSDAARVAELREQEELNLASSATVVAAVGPRLFREVGNLLESKLNKPDIIEFVPGFISPAECRAAPPQLHCLVLGRAEDTELKGLDIATKALDVVASRLNSKLEFLPELVVRGAPEGSGAMLRDELKKLSTSDFHIRVREYSANSEDIVADLRRASILLMPSRHEGFGLVALEALAAGTPILVSDKSGIAELIKKSLPLVQANRVIVSTPEECGAAAENWARSIEMELMDREVSFKRGWEVGTSLAEKFKWADSVGRLLDALENRVRKGM